MRQEKKLKCSGFFMQEIFSSNFVEWKIYEWNSAQLRFTLNISKPKHCFLKCILKWVSVHEMCFLKFCFQIWSTFRNDNISTRYFLLLFAPSPQSLKIPNAQIWFQSDHCIQNNTNKSQWRRTFLESILFLYKTYPKSSLY